MNEIARWTTPSITYKPEAVSISDVDEIVLAVKENGKEILRKTKVDATVSTSGFTWFFSQEDTSLFRDSVSIQIDYTYGTARYTIQPRRYRITESAIDEVI